jgi:hypothetical protein
VGGAPGKIDLYVGKEVVRRGINNETACDELIELIKVRGWRGAWGGWAGWLAGRSAGVAPLCVVRLQLAVVHDGRGLLGCALLPPPNHTQHCCCLCCLQEHGRWQEPPVEEESEPALAGAATA